MHVPLIFFLFRIFFWHFQAKICSIKSDHSAIILAIKSVESQTHGPSFWKFNASLLNDCDYVALINNNYHVWLDEFKDITDPRLLWDLFKYKIRQDTISYSKEKAKERRAKLLELEKNLQHCQELYDEDPSTENMKKLEILKTEYHLMNEYITKGAIVPSRAKWYEEGGKNNKYFLNLENSRGRKSAIRKIFIKDQVPSTNPKAILDELSRFYSNLYQENSESYSETHTDSFLTGISMPKLSDAQRLKCEEKLTVSECYNALKSFQKNKTPGNDGLTAEFYLAFWQILGKHLVASLNYAHEHREQSNSQKQAVITLLEKKRKGQTIH